jgi:hypothetical protein
MYAHELKEKYNLQHKPGLEKGKCIDGIKNYRIEPLIIFLRSLKYRYAHTLSL